MSELQLVFIDRSQITTTIQVSELVKVADTIPFVFDLQLVQDTVVVFTRDTKKNTKIVLNSQLVPLDLALRSGTPFSVNLVLIVPLSQLVPVILDVSMVLNVPVDIALADTER